MNSLNPELRELYPFHSHCLNLGGVLYHFVDEQPGESEGATQPVTAPETIVAVHGNPAWSFTFRGLIAGLRNDYRVVAPDHVGCGLSDKPSDYPYCLEQHIRNLETLIERRELRNVTLVLHDWGGPIGLGYAIRHPENVRRIVLLNTVGFRLPTVPWFLHLSRLPLIGRALIQGANAFTIGATRLGVVRRPLPPAVRRAYAFPFRRMRDRTAVYRFIQDIPTKVDHPSYAVLARIEQELEKLRRHPILIVWGARDPVFRRAALERWRSLFPDAVIEVFDDAGHYVMEDAAEAVLDTIRSFLQRTKRHESPTRIHAH
ncbi:MAG: alpha/beta fold hydrolase [Bdellovibrionales bacterium]|nr:alpha/beta fold hydrolase [Bdellovibrionales bacterium]